jgi:SsrA-binding protein
VPRDPGEKNVATNRRARHDYQIGDVYECGLVLTGDEVKSLREGRASLTDCYARVRDHEMWLEGLNIPPYEQGDKRTFQPTRPRKLLLHRREIDKLAAETAEKGMVLVPLRIYFAHGIAKIEIGLGKGKRQYEKRQSLAKREHEREMEQAAGRRR